MNQPRPLSPQRRQHTSKQTSVTVRNLLLAFLIPFLSIVAIQIVGRYEPFFDGRALLYSDEYHQYFPFFLSFRRALLNGEGMLWNWDVGMGMDFLGLYSYYLASPLNWLSILLPEAWALEYFTLLMPIKLGLAGLFFAIFLKGIFKKNDFSIAVFGSFYALCAFALAYQWNIMWLDSFALLPLVVLGMVRLLRDKKVVLYTVALFFAFVSNYYIGYIVCLFILILFFCYQICRWSGFKRLIADFSRIGIFTVLALGMTLILTLPGLTALQQTQSSDNSLLEKPSISESVDKEDAEDDVRLPSTTKSGMEAILETFGLNICGPYEHNYWELYHEDYSKAQDAWNTLRDASKEGQASFHMYVNLLTASLPLLLTAMARVAGNLGGGQALGFMEGLPNVYCGIGTVFLALLFLTAKEVRFRDKLCSIGLVLFLMLSFIIRQLDYIWHGFHFTNMIPYRFSFLLSFVLLYMAYRAWTLRHQIGLWQVIVAGILSLGILACSDNRTDMSFLIYNLFFLFGVVGIMLLSRLERMLPTAKELAAIPRSLINRHSQLISVLLICVLIMELAMNVVNFGTRFPYTDVRDYPNSTDRAAAAIAVMKEREEGSDFYRAEVTRSQTLNDGALNGFHGITTFSSSANRRVTKFMQNLGQAALPEWNRYCYEDSSPVANLFLNLKYLIERDYEPYRNRYSNAIYTNGDVTLLENNMYLPLGFLAQLDLAKLDMDSIYDPFQKQNRLFSAATALHEDVWKPLDDSCLVISASGPSLTSQSQTGYSTYQSDANGGRIHYKYTVDQTGFMCLNLSFSKDVSYSIFVNNALVQSDYVNLDQMAAVGTVYPGDVVELEIFVNASETGTITVTNGIIDDAVFRQGYDILNASTLDITNFQNTRIEGSVNCNRNGVLYTSIPYDGNWTAQVDGKDVPIVLIGNAMVGVELTEGEHVVVFTYKNRAFELGATVSIICLIIFIAIIVTQNIIRRQRAKALAITSCASLEALDRWLPVIDDEPPLAEDVIEVDENGTANPDIADFGEPEEN